MKHIRVCIYILLSILVISLLIIYSFFRRIFKLKKGNKVLFGTTPIISNKYWSNSLKEIGIESETLMETYYSTINKKEDFDKYFDDVIPKIFRRRYLNRIAHFFYVWKYIIDNAKIFVMSFDGVFFKMYLWKLEYVIFKINNIKIIVIPYGADAYMYSRVNDKSLQNALLISYPNAAKNEKRIEEKVFFWSKYADIVITGFMGCDGMPRWDVAIHQPVIIDTREWTQKTKYSNADGKNGIVKIIHTPNHRGFKGTEYLIRVVEDFKKEGYLIELLLLEKVSNEKVKELMKDADILAEQFIATGYALSGIEGMATGLPVLANLENKNYVNLFRRYSFLNECPILSTSPETLKENLKLLITNPELRKELGELGRKYVEKYHSYNTFQYLFTNIIKKLNGEDIDLINLFHPLKSDFVKKNYIITPLIDNKYLHKDNLPKENT
jgi:glycosyltransferase involved in cell wall biosynthesis